MDRGYDEAGIASNNISRESGRSGAKWPTKYPIRHNKIRNGKLENAYGVMLRREMLQLQPRKETTHSEMYHNWAGPQ